MEEGHKYCGSQRTFIETWLWSRDQDGYREVEKCGDWHRVNQNSEHEQTKV